MLSSFNGYVVYTFLKRNNMKKFDLNIEKILENWEAKHAVREIIANALDEKKLTNSKDIEIFKDTSGNWTIRDFGRGLKYEHFTQKENDEKLSSDGIIGKFGIGLKDALATFERKGVSVKILTKHGDITIGKSKKSGFDDLITLHAYINEPSNPHMDGTLFQLSNISNYDVEQGKQLFLKFNSEKVIEKTKYGDVLSKQSNVGNIYINGVLVATEENFLFSYNITLLNASLKKAINRERANVGRTAYASTVKNILLECQSKEVADLLTRDLRNYSYGSTHDELKWLDVQQHAASTLNKYQKVVFVTSEEIEKGTDLVEEARQGGYDVVTVPTNLRDKLQERNNLELEKNPDNSENILRTFTQFQTERSNNFEFSFVSPDSLNYSEKLIWKLVPEILSIIGGKPYNVNEIVISEVMERDPYTFRPSAALWRPSEKQIIIKRSILSEGRTRFIGVLLHELAHAISSALDSTRAFESELTRLLGIYGEKALNSKAQTHNRPLAQWQVKWLDQVQFLNRAFVHFKSFVLQRPPLHKRQKR